MARLEDELKCEGVHGFGAGYALGKANTPPGHVMEGRDSYCASGCKITQACWMKHRTKVQIMFPNAAKKFDELCAKVGQRHAMYFWRAEAQIANGKTMGILQPISELDPYTMQMTANIQDGEAVAKTGAVKERGRFTLAWPFQRQ